MNNILNLYNMEFKRIYKLYIGLIVILLLGNVFATGAGLYNTIYNISNSDGVRMNIGLLKTDFGQSMLMEYALTNIHASMNMVLGLCVLMCLFYAVAIWYRDFIGRSKTGYTLFMLPTNKFNIYIAKAITVVLMIYGLIISQAIIMFICFGVISILSDMNTTELLSLTTYRNYIHSYSLSLIQPYFRDFIMINILGVILAVLVIFTGVMIQKSFKIIGYIMGALYIIGVIGFYLYLTANWYYTDQVFIAHSIYYIAIFIVSISLSYWLLNKKVHA